MTLASFIELIAKIKQKNNGTFKLVDAQDVECENGKGLDEVLNEKLDKNLGAENTNKVLVTDAEGNVITQNKEDFEGGGTTDYNGLTNKPSINGVELKGQLTSEDLGIIAKADNILKGEIKKSLNPSVDDSFKRELWNLKMYGKSTQATTTGKNKFNIDGNINTLLNGTQGTKNSAENGVLTSNYNALAEQLAGQLISIESGKQYTISLEVISVGSGSKAYVAIFKNGEPFYVPNISVGIWKTTITATVDEILLAFGTNGGTGAKFTNIQVEEGASQTSYEPYSGGKPSPNPEYKQEVTAIDKFEENIVGFNIFPNNVSYSKQYRGLNINVDNGVIEITGTSTGYCDFDYITGEYVGAYSNNQTIKDFYQDKEYVYDYTGNIKANGNIVVKDGSGTVSPHISIYAIDEDFTSVQIVSIDNKGTINFDSARRIKKSIRGFMIRKWHAGICNVKMSDITVSFQLAPPDITQYKGNQLLTHTPTQKMYSTQDGSICDYVDVEKGVEVYHLYAEVLDGSEDEQYTYFSNGFKYTTENIIQKPTTKIINMCDSLKVIAGNITNINNGEIRFSYYNELNKIVVFKINDDITTVEQLKEYLQQNPITIVYVMETPIEIPINEEQLAILRKLYSYEGVTNFLCNGEVSCNYEISQQINNEKLWQAINANGLNIATM